MNLQRERKLKRKSDDPARTKRKRVREEVVEDYYDGFFEDEEEEEVEEVRPVRRPDVRRRKSSFDSLEPREPKRVKKYIIRSIVVDKFTIPRTRVLLTPSMCEVHGCNFDIAVKNGFYGWDDVPRHERRLLLEALEEHKETAHNNSEDYIITEDQMPTRWLGSERGLKDL